MASRPETVNAPLRVARAPGRVNLIGEHTDYNGLPVFPMALNRDVRITFRPRDDGRVLLRNAEERFAPVEFDVGLEIPPGPAGSWGNYVRAAAQILAREATVTRGIEGTVVSTVPVAAGLSSSSALVVATALALLDANGVVLDRTRLMDLLARGERYVGVQGGGMDQAISLGGRAGHALRIDFRPTLRLTPVPVPPDWRIVVAESGVEAAKASGAREGYNSRVRECREALEQFSTRWLGGGPCADYAELGRRIAPEEALTLAAETLTGVHRMRFRHVVSEGRRVDEAEVAMRAGDAIAFGRLMHASHVSLRDDYEVSSPELNRLVEVAESAGALGARLTGAGFGGCIVALAVTGNAEAVHAALEAVSPLVFVAEPGEGAGVE
jgi:galactokinase